MGRSPGGSRKLRLSTRRVSSSWIGVVALKQSTLKERMLLTAESSYRQDECRLELSTPLASSSVPPLKY